MMKTLKLIGMALLAIVVCVCIFVYSEETDAAEESAIRDGLSLAPDDGVKIRKSENSLIQLTDYDGGEFTMKIPRGWTVSKGGYGLYYGIRVYDPADDRNQLFVIVKEDALYKYPQASDMYKISGTGMDLGLYIGGAPTTAQIFKIMNKYAAKVKENRQKYGSPDYAGFEFPRIDNFTVVESFEGNHSLHGYATDDKVLRATFNNGSALNDGQAEGLFQACVVPFNADVFSYYMAYNVCGVTAAKDRLVDYQNILLTCMNSIKLSQSYVQATMDQIRTTGQTALSVGKQLNQAYQSYNDAWSARQKSYDIQSQKRSDATLGYERVYDTETGEIYKAYNGFSDDYQGKRYKTITDSQYTDPIEGYIERRN